MKNRIQHPNQEWEAGRGVRIKKAKFGIVQSAKLICVEQRQRKLKIDDRIDPEFGAGDDDRIGMGRGRERQQKKTPIAFVILEEGVPWLRPRGFHSRVLAECGWQFNRRSVRSEGD